MKKALELQREFNYMPPSDIELLFEWLEDRGYLSKKGIKFREEFWALFIKELGTGEDIKEWVENHGGYQDKDGEWQI